MKLLGMEAWGNLSPAGKLELLGNLLVDLAARIPDLAGGEADTTPPSRQEFDAVKEVVSGMVELHQAIEKKFAKASSVAATIASNSARLEALEQAKVSDIEEVKAALGIDQIKVEIVAVQDQIGGKILDINSIRELVKKFNERIDVMQSSLASLVESQVTMTDVQARLDAVVTEIHDRIDKAFDAPKSDKKPK